jgi:glycosyltransferase involved in cell wall biosynthesis
MSARPIVHLFNSSVVSGPETLVIPALKRLGEPVSIVFLEETRLDVGAKGPVAYARELGHDVHTVRVRSRWDRRAFGELRNVLDRLSPRIVHAHDVKASLYLLKASKLGGRDSFKPKLVSTHHGAAARKGIIRLYEEIYVRWALPHFDAVLCVCEGDYASLKRRGVPGDLLQIHYNGVDRIHVPPEARAKAQRQIRAGWRALDPGLPGPEEAVFLGAVARLSDEKRHDRMIRALAEAKRLRPEQAFVLLCFGIGAEEAKLKALTRTLGMESEIRWMGYSKTIGQEMAGFDLLLCLSDGEGIPINLIEAGWSGTPVLSTSVGGIPDLLNSNEVGYLVSKQESDTQIGTELARIMADSSGRKATGLRYQERIVTQFSERAWLDQLRAFYARLG